QILGKRATRSRCEAKLRDVGQGRVAPHDPVHMAGLREMAAVLDEELRNLPAVCRAALIVCHLEGLSTTEAAHRLGLPASTLKSRLQRGRDLLRGRLERRGIGLSAAALTAALAEQSCAGAPPALIHVTVQAALCVAASGTVPITTRAGSLAGGAVGTGVYRKVALAVAAVLDLVLVGLAAAFSTSSPAGTAANDNDSVSPRQGAALADGGPKQVGLDGLGDPLPPGAILRLGTARMRHQWGVEAVGFSLDGKHVVSAGGHSLRVWDAATGKELRQLQAINIFGFAV